MELTYSINCGVKILQFQNINQCFKSTFSNYALPQAYLLLIKKHFDE